MATQNKDEQEYDEDFEDIKKKKEEEAEIK
jgi:hypothetical protein